MDLIELIEICKDKLVIVEGIKDKRCLEELGFLNVIKLKGALYLFAESVALKHNDVIILCDLDLEGKKIYAKLNHALCQNGVRVDNRLRNYLFRNTNLRQIEGLQRYIQNQKRI